MFTRIRVIIIICCIYIAGDVVWHINRIRSLNTDISEYKTLQKKDSVWNTVNSAYQLTVAGKSCNVWKPPYNNGVDQRDCEYKVGSQLHIIIAGVGDVDGTVSFETSDVDGYYWGAFELGGCVIIKPGNKNSVFGPTGGFNFAYISPKTGEVFDSRFSCISSLEP